MGGRKLSCHSVSVARTCRVGRLGKALQMASVVWTQVLSLFLSPGKQYDLPIRNSFFEDKSRAKNVPVLTLNSLQELFSQFFQDVFLS